MVHFSTVFKDVVAEQIGKQGAGLRILTETVTSPSMGAQMKDLLARYPSAKWIQWDPIGLGRREGTQARVRFVRQSDLQVRRG